MAGMTQAEAHGHDHGPGGMRAHVSDVDRRRYSAIVLHAVAVECGDESPSDGQQGLDTGQSEAGFVC